MNTTLIGSGIAAWTVARELRKRNPAHTIRMITANSGDFYSKPMLSNALASGKTPQTLVMNSANALASQQTIELINHTTVEQINRETKTVSTTQGEFAYDRLVLALGASPIQLLIQGNGAQHVLSVNDLWDYTLFRQALEGKQDVAVLGAGLIGCEFANDLLKINAKPVVFDLATRPLARLLPEQASEFMKNKLQDQGVTWKLGRTVTEIEQNDGEYVLKDSLGETTRAQLVLSAVGLVPHTKLAAQAGLITERGILVDKFGRTNDANIFALGDCAQYMGNLVLPYIMPVMQAGRAIAQTLDGQDTEIRFPAMPVVVKTPDCPVVISPPLAHHVGAWEVEVGEMGVKALFKSAEGLLLGMALVGEASKERQALSGQLPAVA